MPNTTTSNVIDDHIVLEGSFNWYNASVFSHDIVIVAANHHIAEPYLFEFDQIPEAFAHFLVSPALRMGVAQSRA